MSMSARTLLLIGLVAITGAITLVITGNSEQPRMQVLSPAAAEEIVGGVDDPMDCGVDKDCVDPEPSCPSKDCFQAADPNKCAYWDDYLLAEMNECDRSCFEGEGPPEHCIVSQLCKCYDVVTFTKNPAFACDADAWCDLHTYESTLTKWFYDDCTTE